MGTEDFGAGCVNRLGMGSMARLPIPALVGDACSWSVSGVIGSASDFAGKARRGRRPGSVVDPS
jgi:hypothetical protein